MATNEPLNVGDLVKVGKGKLTWRIEEFWETEHQIYVVLNRPDTPWVHTSAAIERVVAA